jgi:hypothetical protein
MAFMRATLSKGKDLFLISDDLDNVVFCTYNNIPVTKVGVYDDDEVEEIEDPELRETVALTFALFPSMRSFEIVEQFHGQLSASGYLDHTDVTLGDSHAEVAQQLLDMYFDGDPEYMDEGEKADMAWLERVAKGEDPEAAL